MPSCERAYNCHHWPWTARTRSCIVLTESESELSIMIMDLKCDHTGKWFIRIKFEPPIWCFGFQTFLHRCRRYRLCKWVAWAHFVFSKKPRARWKLTRNMHNRGAASYRHRFVESTKACTFKLKEASVFLWKYAFIPSLERKAGGRKKKQYSRPEIWKISDVNHLWLDRQIDRLIWKKKKYRRKKLNCLIVVVREVGNGVQ